MNLTEEQMVALAEEKATTTRGMRMVINRLLLETLQDKSYFNKARRRVYKLEKANGELSPLEYAYALNHELTDIVNEQYR